MSIQMTNTTFELRITPTKRKRDVLKDQKSQNSGKSNKENHFVYNNFMEVKSIADLVKINANYSTNKCVSVCNNEFEVIQKPPKKKNRKHIAEENCFVNSALNLNGPEHVVNPFEVKRSAISTTLVEPVQNCFENNGFTIRGEERKAHNPFEIQREAIGPAPVNGIENPGLEIQSTPLAIGVPFTPTLGCRIDFKNVAIESLTPSTLMNRQLVFSPIAKPIVDATPKRANLSIISEEAVDISKELDGYQLELENSMNEAKATKKHENKNLMDIKRKNAFAKRLCEAIENGVDPDAPNPMRIDGIEQKNTENDKNDGCSEMPKENEEHFCNDSSNGHRDCPKSSTPKTPNENCIAKYSLNDRSLNENPDVVYEEVEETKLNFDADMKEPESKRVMTEEEDLFKNPAPFVRAYRRDACKRPTVKITDPVQINNEKESKLDEKSKETKDTNNEMFGGLRSSIRKSIRKLMPNTNSGKNKSPETESAASEPKEPSQNILTTIRHSLRRKQPKQPLATSTPCESLNDISIIDAVPRPVFKEADLAARFLTDANDDGVFRTKTNIRRSLRNSSRNVMRNVFKKNVEGYEFD